MTVMTPPFLLLPLLLLVTVSTDSTVAVSLTPPHFNFNSHSFNGKSQSQSKSYYWHKNLNEKETQQDNPISLLDATEASSYDPCTSIRGGSGSGSSSSNSNSGSRNSKSNSGSSTSSSNSNSKTSLFATTKEYWFNKFSQATFAIRKPFRSGPQFFQKPSFLQSPDERRQKELMMQLQTTPILSVKIVPSNSTVVPPAVVQIAAKRAGLIGKPLLTNAQAVQQVAQSLRQWYDRQGYILHSMTGATLQLETQTAELTVQEPISSNVPVQIVHCDEMVISPTDPDKLLTIRQYRDQLASHDSDGIASTSTTSASTMGRFGRRSRPKLDRTTVNTTFVPTDKRGRTDPNRMATILGLQAGQPFRWNAQRWQIVSNRLFQKKLLRATPQRLQDGTVQLQLIVQEAPARHLEYGISKSLYTDSWEGEIDFAHQNLLGGGESLGITVRRGTHDAEPSIRVQLQNDHFGILPRGYNVQIFSDYIGEHLEDESSSGGSSGSGSSSSEGAFSTTKAEDYNHDELLDRKGTSVSIRSPFGKTLVQTASACLERTTTKGGRHESVGSTTLNLGPIRKQLPLQAKTSVFGKVTTGARTGEQEALSSDTTTTTDTRSLLPFCSVQATTRQLFPLTNGRRPWVLALSHSATASTKHLPRHEANAQGVAGKIRGYHKGTKSARISNSVVGTTELRIPVPLPKQLLVNGGVAADNASLVLFGDWCFSQSTQKSSFQRRSSVGVGLRKNLQGFPIKYDLTYTQDHKIGAFFGLGPDFDV